MQRDEEVYCQPVTEEAAAAKVNGGAELEEMKVEPREVELPLASAAPVTPAPAPAPSMASLMKHRFLDLVPRTPPTEEPPQPPQPLQPQPQQMAAVRSAPQTLRQRRHRQARRELQEFLRAADEARVQGDDASVDSFSDAESLASSVDSDTEDDPEEHSPDLHTPSSTRGANDGAVSFRLLGSMYWDVHGSLQREVPQFMEVPSPRSENEVDLSTSTPVTSATTAEEAAAAEVPSAPVVSCEICFGRDVAPGYVFCQVCEFPVCQQCSVRHVMSLATRTGRAQCVNFRCETAIPEEKLVEILERKQLQKLRRMLDRLNPDLHECPQCNEFSPVTGMQRRFKCQNCEAQSCTNCSREWGHVQCAARMCSPEPKEFQLWRMFKNVRHCPKCRNAIEKDGGCPHMTCTYCSYEFCWNCKQPWHRHNDSLCGPMRIIKHRSVFFGPIKPVRAVTKSATLVVVGTTVCVGYITYGVVWVSGKAVIGAGKAIKGVVSR
mmetsp:Transcript_27920/g.88941  ORF Transcript_27920/g.88941 Transcript_27920/m.88941 type:complete len:492 (-) Transcript_27920:158-1633(-)